MLKALFKLLCCLFIHHYAQAAVITPIGSYWSDCLLTNNICSLTNLIGTTTITASDDLDLSGTSLLAPRIQVLLDRSFVANSITFGGPLLSSGVTFAFRRDDYTITANTIVIGTNTLVNVTGTLVATGKTTIASNSGVVVTKVANFSGGVDVDAGATGSNQGIRVVGGGSLIIGADSAISGTLELAALSTFTITNGVVTLGQALTASGNVIIGSTLTLSSSLYTYTQAAGDLTLVSSGASYAVINADVTLQSQTRLLGNGNVTGSVTLIRDSKIAPGASPGTVYINGDLVMSTTSTFDLEVASAASYDKVIVRGKVNLNGILYVTLLNAYKPDKDDRYTFISSVGSTSGDFLATHGDLNANFFTFAHEVHDHYVLALYNSASTTAASVVLMIVAFLVVNM
jgi:hypothetical protein